MKKSYVTKLPVNPFASLSRLFIAIFIFASVAVIFFVTTPFVGTSFDGPNQAGAQARKQCSTSVGVIVVVDFSYFGGEIERGCSATPTTALGALLTAGFATNGDAVSGDAFVCRIDGFPDVTQTPCTDTPPASATWSLWFANQGTQNWTYATLGVLTQHPKPGSVEAWTFGKSTTRPTFLPATVRATNTTPSASQTTTSVSQTPPTTALKQSASATSTTLTHATSRAGSTSSTHAVTTLPQTSQKSASGEKIVPVSPPKKKASPSGTATSFIVGGVVIVLVASAGVFISRRKKKR